MMQWPRGRDLIERGFQLVHQDGDTLLRLPDGTLCEWSDRVRCGLHEFDALDLIGRIEGDRNVGEMIAWVKAWRPPPTGRPPKRKPRRNLDLRGREFETEPKDGIGK